MTRKQESPGISGCSREETWLLPRPGGYGGLLHAFVQPSRYRWPLFSDYWPPLTCTRKSPTPGNDRVKSISGASGPGCPSWFLKPEWSLP